jgi:quercetin dioxygenase-like cupin family protein
MEKVIVGNYREIEPQIINNEIVKNVEKRILIGSKMGAPNFVMRLFIVKPGGNSPRHTHFWEHEVYILKGEGEVFNGTVYEKINEGSYVFVPPNVEHQFKNTSDEDLHFLCIIPRTADEE